MQTLPLPPSSSCVGLERHLSVFEIRREPRQIVYAPTDSLNYPLFNPISVLSQRSRLKLSDEWAHRAVKTIRTRPTNILTVNQKIVEKQPEESKHCVNNILWTIYIWYISREKFQKQQSLIFHVSCQQEQKRMKMLGAVWIKKDIHFPFGCRFFPLFLSH